MSIGERVQKDLVEAMKARNELRLSTLRMMKAALKNKEVEKMGKLEEREELQVFTTMIKQRKDSVEQFTKGGRQDLADKETAEIAIIEGYMPKALGEEEITAAVRSAIAEMGAPSMKDMGGDEERHGPLRRRRRARGRQNRQRAGAQGTGRKIGAVVIPSGASQAQPRRAQSKDLYSARHL